MSEIEWLTHAQVAPLVGEDVTVDDGAGAVRTMRLVEATESDALGGPGPDGQQRRQFRLLFVSGEDTVLPQATYVMGLPSLGTLDVFLVPVGRDGDGVHYEAVFA